MAFRYSFDGKPRDLKVRDIPFDVEWFSQVMEKALDILSDIKEKLDKIAYAQASREIMEGFQ